MKDTAGIEKAGRLRCRDHDFAVEQDRLLITKYGRLVAALTMAPASEGQQRHVSRWDQRADGQWVGAVDGFGSVTVQIKHGYPCLSFQTTTAWFDSLIAIPAIEFVGSRWTTFVSDELDRVWDLNEDVNVPVSSCYADLFHPDGHDGGGPMDPGDRPPLFNWNMHIRAAALETDGGWVGLAIPGPLPVGVTRFRTHNRRLSLTFEALRTTCPDWGAPEVYIITGLAQRDDLLDIYRELSERLGLTVERNVEHPTWWANPVFDSWEEVCRRLKTGAADEAEAPTGEEYLQALPAPDYTRANDIITLPNYRKWLQSVRDTTGIQSINTTFEQSCFRLYGDYTPIDGLGGTAGLRKQIDAWRAQGTHVSFYIHPFLVNKRVSFYREHPEAFCQPKDGRTTVAYALEFYDRQPEYALVDWTHPLGRQFMLDTVRYLLSPEDGCLNCDILRSNHWRAPDPRVFSFHDPDWGTGDLMSMKVQRLLHEQAKRIKPHAMVSKVGFADPYMQPYADMDYLSEEWSHSTDNWNRRARIATRTIRGCLFLVDQFVGTLTKLTETFSSFLAYSVPNISMVRHALHPQMFYRNVRPIDYRRRRAGVAVYMNAPAETSDVCRVNWNEATRDVEIWRKRTRGPLAGWYAAKAFGKKCFVTYGEHEARIATCVDRHVQVELPPEYEVESVRAVAHDQTETPWEHSLATADGHTRVDLYAQDCGGQTLYYRIAYHKTPR